MAGRNRLDALVVARGLADTRSRARALILAGHVRVNDAVESKAGTQVAFDAHITVAEPDHPYVGRGGIKLAYALDRFGIDVHGRTALDIGASTGGFTDVILQRGAAHVVALDVGRAQLDWKLRSDRRVTVVEGANARYLTPDAPPGGIRQFDLITIDVSFISLRLVLPVVPSLLGSNADVVALVKPQFEAGRAEISKGGIVRSPDVHARVVKEVAIASNALGLTQVSMTASPIDGAEGNREFFLHLRCGTIP